MKPLLVLGIAIVLVGGFLVVFGAVYSTTYYLQGFSTSGDGNFHTSFQNVVISYYLYPIWSPPIWHHANFSLPCPIQQGWYTPLGPVPSCLPPPISSSASYALNLIGIALTMLGIVAMVRTSIQRPPKIDSPNHGLQT